MKKLVYLLLFFLMSFISQSSFASQDTSSISGKLKDGDLLKSLLSLKYDNYIGNKDANIAVIDFFDYNCSDCKSIVPALKDLVKSDKDVEVIFMEYPKLGNGSVFAAKAALASLKFGKYKEVHEALISHKGKLKEKNDVMEVLKGIGIKEDDVNANIDSIKDILLEQMTLGDKLGVKYVPTVIVTYTKVPYNPTVLAEPAPEELLKAVAKYKNKSK